jgi:hypothetical protein
MPPRMQHVGLRSGHPVLSPSAPAIIAEAGALKSAMDLDTRGDIDALMIRFYGRALV